MGEERAAAGGAGGSTQDVAGTGASAEMEKAPQAQCACGRRNGCCCRGFLKAVAGGLVVGTLAAGVAWWVTGAEYRAEATIRVRAMVQPAVYHLPVNEPLTDYERHMRTLEELIASDRVMEWARTTPDWRAAVENHGLSRTEFADRLKVRWKANSEFIKIEFRDPDPRLAHAGANAVLEAYRQVGADGGEVKRTEVREKLRTTLMNEVSDLQARIKAVADEFGAYDLGAIREYRVQRFNKAEEDLQLSKIQLAYAQAAAGMRPEARNPASAGGGSETEAALQIARLRMEQIEKLRNELRSEVISLGQKQLALDDLSRHMQRNQEELVKVTQAIAQNSVESEVAQRMEFVAADLPEKENWQRRNCAAGWWGGGGFLLGMIATAIACCARRPRQA